MADGGDAFDPGSAPPEWRRGAVLVAPERWRRPNAGVAGGPTEDECPFCPGREDRTTPTEYALTADGRPEVRPSEWAVRVFANLYPSLRPGLPALSAQERGDPRRRSMPAEGVCEVLVVRPGHAATLGDLSVAQWRLIFRAYQDRLRHYRAGGRYNCAALFHNAGRRGGASMEHAHSQLIVMEFPPPRLRARWQDEATVLQRFGEVLGAGPDWERDAAPDLMVAEDDQFVLWCPNESEYPWELRVAPSRAGPRFEDLSPGARGALADHWRRVVAALERRFGVTDYNYMLSPTPWPTPAMRKTFPVPPEAFSWCWRLTPRLVTPAGFEIATGAAINPVPPEEAAQRWRQALAEVRVEENSE